MGSLRSIALPFVGLVTLLTVATIFAVAIMVKGGEMSDSSVTLYNASFAYILAWGVELDRKAIGRSAPFEYAAFMFFLWWVLFPVYLFQTRRWRGLAIAFGILLSSSLPTMVAYGVFMLYGPAL
jgi:hypothetical protein